MKLKQFIRGDVINFQEYKTVSSVWDLARKFNKKESEINKLDQGENFFGVSPAIAKELGSYKFYNYYPDPEYNDLRKAISKSYEIPFEKIMVGSGSDELIDLLFRMVVEVSDEVINFPPTFGMYDVSLKLNRAKVINIKRDENFNINVDAALKAINKKTKMIIVCSPNNPTGNPTPKADIIKLLDTGKLIMLDEAYAEFADNDNLDLIRNYPNLIILRTFSKWAGMAGLRLGFVAMDEYLISQLMKIKSPFNVNLAAEVAGIAVLKDLKFAKENIAKLKVERERLFDELKKISYLKVFSSETNFIFAQVQVFNFDDFRKYLLKNQTLLRYFESELVGKSVRITISTPQVNNKVVELFKSYPDKPQKFDGIIFDMDGVLVDETNSCRLAIVKTVNYFLKKDNLKVQITKNEVNKIKTLPGFNDDIDSSFAILELIKKNKGVSEYPKFTKVVTTSQKKSVRYKEIYEVWQTFYLGSELFKKIDKRNPVWEGEKGLIYNETLLVSKDTLKKLSESYTLAIATGRPKAEAEFAVNYFGLDKFFDKNAVVGKEDAKFTKPNPSPLLEAKKRINSSQPIYVGDTINDVLAAKKAGMKSVFIGEGLGDYQIKSVNNLVEELL